MGGHAYIDESCQGDYLVVSAFIASADVVAARKQLRGLLLGNQRSIHMKDEKKPARQQEIVDVVLSLGSNVTIYCAKPSEHRGHSGARDVCLRALAADSVRTGVDRMMLDRNDSYVQRDRNSIIQGSQSAGAHRVPFTYDHCRRHEEALLWVPDVVGWCYARGNPWRQKILPITTVKGL